MTPSTFEPNGWQRWRVPLFWSNFTLHTLSLFCRPTVQDGDWYRFLRLFFLLERWEKSKARDDKTCPESHRLEVIEDRIRTWTSFCLSLKPHAPFILLHNLPPGSRDHHQGPHWAVSLTGGRMIADQPVFRNQRSFSHLHWLSWEICFLLPSLQFWLI